VEHTKKRRRRAGLVDDHKKAGTSKQGGKIPEGEDLRVPRATEGPDPGGAGKRAKHCVFGRLKRGKKMTTKETPVLWCAHVACQRTACAFTTRT